jgi:regulation of enolase protein 1 (concanavalin A-like superfamily)
MQNATLLVVCCWLVSCGLLRSAAFIDDFRGHLGEGWWWVREDAKAWRTTDSGLEVRMQPGNMWGGANDAKNLLVRKAPDTSEQEVVVTVQVTNDPKEQYEQVDLVWYFDDSHMVKIGQELVDGQLSIVMGREEKDQCRTVIIIPIEAKTLELRQRVRGQGIVGEYRLPGEQAWRRAGSCDLPVHGEAKICLQFYQGPAEVERWARVTGFRVENRR